MATEIKTGFLNELGTRFPTLKREEKGSQSLFEIPETFGRVYIRYSKVHPNGRTFFGLRETDLKWLEGHKALLCFLWDGQQLPLIIPYAAFEDVFASASPAQDGQYKVQIYPDPESTELYIAGQGGSMLRGTWVGTN